MKRNYYSLLLPGFFLYSVSTGVNAQSFTDLKVSVSNNDNISYGFYSRDIKSDNIVSTKLSYGIPKPAGTYGTLTYMFSGQMDIYTEFSDLNTVQADAGLYYKSKFGVGLTVPWYQVGINAAYRSVADDLRDASIFGATATIGKRFSEQFNASLNYSFSSTNAADKTFDATLQSVSLSADYLLSDDWLLFGSYANYSGDLVATTIPYAQIIDQSDSITRDDAYGTDVARFAYRLDASTNVLKLGVNYYLSENSSLELVYKQRDSSIGYWTDYTSKIITVNYLYSF